MQEFSFSDLSRMVGQIVDAAMLGPVALTKHGRRKLILLPAAEYDRLLQNGAVQGATELSVAKEERPATETKPIAKIGRLSALRSTQVGEDQN